MERAVSVEIFFELADVYVLALLEQKNLSGMQINRKLSRNRRKKDIWKDLVNFMSCGKL